MPNPNKTLIAAILDRSGSMSGVRDDIIGGFNTFITDQRKTPGECSVTLAQFDDQYEIIHNNKPIQEVPNLDFTTYVPRGNTALNDAVGRTINAIGSELSKLSENDRPGNVIVVIITDGLENASSEFSGAQVKRMIEHQQEKYKWHFTYLAASMDKAHVTVASSIGIRSSAYNQSSRSAQGSNALFSASSAAVSRLRNGVDKNFTYSAEEVSVANQVGLNSADK